MGNPKQIDSLIRLISMKRRLTGFSLDVHDNLDRTNEVVTNERVLFQQKDYHDNVLESISQLTQSIDHYNTELDALINYLDSSIRRLEIKVIQDNYRNYESFNTTIKERLEIRSQFSSSLNEYIYGIKNSTDSWQYAGLDMWPTDPKFTRETVANDPLYIIANTELHVLNQLNIFNNYNHKIEDFNSINEKYDTSFNIIGNVLLFKIKI